MNWASRVNAFSPVSTSASGGPSGVSGSDASSRPDTSIAASALAQDCWVSVNASAWPSPSVRHTSYSGLTG